MWRLVQFLCSSFIVSCLKQYFWSIVGSISSFHIGWDFCFYDFYMLIKSTTFITLCKCSHLDMHMAEEIMLRKHGVSPFESAIYWKPQCINCKSRNVEFKRIKTYFYKSVDCVVSNLEVYAVLLSHLGTSVVCTHGWSSKHTLMWTALNLALGEQLGVGALLKGTLSVGVGDYHSITSPSTFF